MQAIITRYLPPTNTKPSRVKASCARGSVTISYPHELSGEEVHVFAASALVAKFVKEDVAQYKTPADKNPWNRKRVVGQLPSGEHAHAFVS